MNGETESPKETTKRTAKDKFEHITETIKTYLKAKGIYLVKKPEAQHYLEMTQDELRAMSADECGEAAFLLSQFAYWLRQQYNLEMMRVRLCDAEIDKQIGRRIQSYDKYMKWEEKRLAAISEDSHAAAWMELRKWAEASATMQDSLVFDTKNIMNTLLQQQRSKERDKYGKI
jgi:hypothetical protein